MLMSRTLEQWTQSCLRENALSDVVQWFIQHGQESLHCDRHVAEEFPLDITDADSIMGGCEVGVALLMAWEKDRKDLKQVAISKPRLLIETSWLRGLRDSSPPHVYICLYRLGAKSPEVTMDIDREPQNIPQAFSDLLHRFGDQLDLGYCPAEDDDLPSAWIIEVKN